MQVSSWDVAIAGAGPAGSALALHLARAGFAVALVEPARFPRHKPCGEFLSPQCLPMLERLGVLDELRALGAQQVRGMRIHGAGRVAHGRFVDVGRVAAPCDHGLAVGRDVLDHALLRAAVRAGAGLIEGARAEAVLRERDGRVGGLALRRRCETPGELRARWTVGADGLRSRVAGDLGLRQTRPWLDKLALVTRYRTSLRADHARVHLLHDGYFAMAPVDGGRWSVNLVVQRASFRAARLPALAFLEQRLESVPALAAELAGAERVDPVRGVGPLSGTTSRQVVDGAALVGDACGYVDPVTGEGIFFALRGAELLAGALDTALHARRTDAAALAPYLRGRREDILPRERLGLLLQRGLRHPRVVGAVLGLLERRPALADVLVSLTGDYAPQRELLRPSAWVRALA